MKNEKKVLMGSQLPQWEGNGHLTKSITFSVTEDCNLACKYCYMTGKNHKRKMSFEVAKKAVDYILNDKDICNTGAVVWDFIGGEPFLEIDLIDKISDYIKQQMFLLNHPWFNAYRFNFSSNGVLYDTEKVQTYIQKNRGHINIGLSVDGNKTKHDLQRIYIDGSGSYDEVVKNVPLWLKQFPNATTKATFAHDDLPYLKDSIISLWNIGIKIVAANVVFEDVWHDGDDIIFEQQLKELADYIVEYKLWNEYSVRFFTYNIGLPLEEEDKLKNFCGAGEMLAIDCDGNFYPCIRFLDFSLTNRNGRKIGDINSGINYDKLRPFKALTLKHQCKKECLDCEVATGCAWCTGCNYDLADTDTIYQRATFNCKMHKANIRANDYFWNRYSEATGEISPRHVFMKDRNNKKNSIGLYRRFLQILTSDNIEPHCNYRNWNNYNNNMDVDMIKKAMKFAEINNFIPVIIGDNYLQTDGNVLRIHSSRNPNVSKGSIVVYDNNVEKLNLKANNSILLINIHNIEKIADFINKLSEKNLRINIVLEDIEKWDEHNFKQYEDQLHKVIDKIIENYKEDKEIQINVLTDRLNLDNMCNCDAGTESFTVAPNGKLYICPAFYFDNSESHIGDLEKGISIKNEQLLHIEYSPICLECDSYHCNRCKFLNKKLTEEYNTPSKIQCKISHLERNASSTLQKRLIDENIIESGKVKNVIQVISYTDPLERLVR